MPGRERSRSRKKDASDAKPRPDRTRSRHLGAQAMTVAERVRESELETAITLHFWKPRGGVSGPVAELKP